jgi:hypothetical protein
MPVKKKPGNGPIKKPAPTIDAAVVAIQRRYGNNVAGAKTMREAIQGLKDTVAESSLVDKFSSRTLDAAATRVAQNAFQGMKRAEKSGKKK